VAEGKNYQTIDLVATGGTAVLYRAVQTSLDRVVAVKKLHHHLTTDENFTRRFALEAKAAASLDHENIVKIIDFGVEDGTYMMVMEFIDGESLKEVLEKWRQVPANLALALVHQICMGLEHAHAKGIVHRDIKPGNIMLTRAGKVKITDFGLAKLSQSQVQHTAANSILGTPLYMSPEQAFGESVDHRSDLFSLGTVLYECLTGRQPFEDESYMAVIQNIIHHAAPNPSQFGVDIPDAIGTIVVKAMNKNRDARFQSARQFRLAIEKHLGLDALKQATDDLKSLLSTDGETMVLPPTERARKRSRRVKLALAGTVTLAVMSGAAVGFLAAPESVRARIEKVYAWIGADEPAPPRGRLAVAGTQSGFERVVFPEETASTREEPPSAATADTVATPDSTATDSSRTDAPATSVSAPSAPAPAQSTATVDAVPEPPARIRRTGWLSITSDPAAEVFVDERYLGATPLMSIELTGGSHTLECRSPKHESYREVLQIKPGELSSRSIVLQKLLGRITLSTIAGAEVHVDGVLIGVTPLQAPIELAAGRHQLTVKKAGYHVWNNTVTLDAKQLLPLNITLSPIY
jgi:tRNA A-37 threonylcarbamoyl transferase component Bud32